MKINYSKVLAELRQAVQTGSGSGWILLTEDSLKVLMNSLGVTSAAELLSKQAEFVTVPCYFVLETPPSEGKGAKYTSLANPFQGVEGGLTTIDWSNKISTPYASGVIRKCTREGIVFWLAEKPTGKYETGFYYRVARKGESKASVKQGLTKKPV
jgi:hypothetical protein